MIQSNVGVESSMETSLENNNEIEIEPPNIWNSLSNMGKWVVGHT